MIIAPTYGFEHHVAFAVLAIALVCLLVAQGALRTPWTWVLVVALALLTEHEASSVPPAMGSPGAWAASSGTRQKLVPLLGVFAGALVAGRPAAGAPAASTVTTVTPSPPLSVPSTRREKRPRRR